MVVVERRRRDFAAFGFKPLGERAVAFEVALGQAAVEFLAEL